jgi:hypothetical protein
MNQAMYPGFIRQSRNWTIMFHVEQNLANEIIALLMQAKFHPMGMA